MKTQPRKPTKMATKNNPSKSSQIARAYMLSFPQFFVWALIFGAIGGLTVWKSEAAQRNQGGGTISLIAPSNSDGLPHFGDKVKFAISQNRTDRPWVHVQCMQNSTVVLTDYRGYYTGYVLDQKTPLGPTQLWKSGAADCTAELMYFKNGTPQRPLASTSFYVNP